MRKIESFLLFGLLFSNFCFAPEVACQEFGFDDCLIEEIIIFGHKALLIEFETPVAEERSPELLVLRCSFNIQGVPNEDFQKFIFDVIPWHQDLSEIDARTSVCGSYWVSDEENICLDLTHIAHCSDGLLRVRCLVIPLSIPSAVNGFSLSAEKGFSVGGLSLIMSPEVAAYSSSYIGGKDVMESLVNFHTNTRKDVTGLSLVAYPNPFNAKLYFKFTAPAGQLVSGRLDIYDLRGRRLVSDKIFFDGELVYSWNGQTDTGVTVPSGNYFVSFTNKGSGEKTTLPVLLIK